MHADKLTILKIFHCIQDFKSETRTIVTLGTFDGVHIGHKKIIERLIKAKQESDCESLVLTFFPHPRMVLQENSEIKLLNTIAERTALLSGTGLDNLIIHPFDQEFSRLTAEEFVRDILVEKFNISKIIIGYDHRFGRNRTATIDDLIAFGQIYNFEVEQISAQEIDEVSVSSTKIRTALLEGNIALANSYLGYEYTLSGIVVKGKQIGRTINFHTANIHIAEDYKLIPLNGVYIIKSEMDGATVYGMMNIGFNPTVNGTKQTIEAHFFDFNADIYGKEIQVAILSRIRAEEKFDSLVRLQEELENDKKIALDYIKHL